VFVERICVTLRDVQRMCIVVPFLLMLYCDIAIRFFIVDGWLFIKMCIFRLVFHVFESLAFLLSVFAIAVPCLVVVSTVCARLFSSAVGRSVPVCLALVTQLYHNREEWLLCEEEWLGRGEGLTDLP
jgi:hypothetical protein